MNTKICILNGPKVTDRHASGSPYGSTWGGVLSLKFYITTFMGFCPRFSSRNSLSWLMVVTGITSTFSLKRHWHMSTKVNLHCQVDCVICQERVCRPERWPFASVNWEWPSLCPDSKLTEGSLSFSGEISTSPFSVQNMERKVDTLTTMTKTRPHHYHQHQWQTVFRMTKCFACASLPLTVIKIPGNSAASQYSPKTAPDMEQVLGKQVME